MRRVDPRLGTVFLVHADLRIEADRGHEVGVAAGEDRPRGEEKLAQLDVAAVLGDPWQDRPPVAEAESDRLTPGERPVEAEDVEVGAVLGPVGTAVEGPGEPLPSGAAGDGEPV
jgi:hypothetical protein